MHLHWHAPADQAALVVTDSRTDCRPPQQNSNPFSMVGFCMTFPFISNLTCCSGTQARPSSAGAGASSAAAQEAAAAAVEEEWSGRVAEALALCQEQEAALERLQRQSMRACK